MTHRIDQLVSGLARIAVFWRAASWQRAAGAGLNPTQAEILAYLARRSSERPVRLAAELGITPASLSDSLTSLASKGLIERLRDPDDGRGVRIVLTHGGSALQAAMPEAPDTLVEALEALPEGEQGQMLRALTRIIRTLQQARAIPTQRMCVSCSHFRPHVHADANAPHHCAFVDAPFGDASLRLDCADHEVAEEEERARIWARFEAAA